MSKFPELIASAFFAVMLAAAPALGAGDADQGGKVFKKCKACHAVGSGAKNKVGPHLNDLFGRPAGSITGYKYSKAMRKASEAGLVWSDETIDKFLAKPRGFLKGTKMAFPGIKKEKDRRDLLAYLKAIQTASTSTPTAEKPIKTVAAPAGKPPLASDTKRPKHGVLHLGRAATSAEILAWDIDIRPDGAGLPKGKGTVAQGEEVFAERCAVCHGDFGEGKDRWPVLAGGFDTLKAERPEKTIGSYWPFLSTVFDYIRRAMPFGDARSLTDDEVYAVTAYLLFLNDIVTDTEFELSEKNFAATRLPNEANFIADDRASEQQYANTGEPCMNNCMAEPAQVIMRARVLDVTPENEGDGSKVD